MSRRAGFTVAALALAVGGAWSLGSQEGERLGALAGLRAPSLMAAGSHAADDAAVALPSSGGATAAGALDPVEQRVFVEGSLRGTDFPAWGVPDGGPLQPNRALRDRFDHYLLGMGEATLAELGALVKRHAVRDLGAATAAEKQTASS